MSRRSVRNRSRTCRSAGLHRRVEEAPARRRAALVDHLGKFSTIAGYAIHLKLRMFIDFSTFMRSPRAVMFRFQPSSSFIIDTPFHACFAQPAASSASPVSEG